MKRFVPVHFKRLYKYTHSAYLDPILRQGVFRVGTLYEYRNYDHAQIGDAGEGVQTFTFSSGHGIAGLSAHELNAAYPKLRLAESERATTVVTSAEPGVPVAIEVHSPDCYLFCMTEVFDPEVMRSFGYDACLEITDPSQFFFQLSQAMRPHAVSGSLEPCQYGSRYGTHETHFDVRPQLLKPDHLRSQSEVRITWDPPPRRDASWPNGSSLHPLLIQRRKATRFLRRIR